MKKTCYLMSSCLSYVLFLQVAQLATSELFVSKALASTQHSTSQSMSMSASAGNVAQLPNKITYDKYVAGINASQKFINANLSLSESMVGDFIRAIDLSLDEKVYAIGPDDPDLKLYGVQQIIQTTPATGVSGSNTTKKKKSKTAAVSSSSSTVVSQIKADNTAGMFPIADIRFTGGADILTSMAKNQEVSSEQLQSVQQPLLQQH